MTPRPKYYAVRNGYQPGVYTSWAECQEQVNGFSGCVFKSFSSLAEANAFMEPSPKSIPPHQSRINESSSPFTPRLKYYAVRNGHQPGVYTSWAECQEQVNGFSGCVFKSFPSLAEANAFVESSAKSIPPYQSRMESSSPVRSYQSRINESNSLESLMRNLSLDSPHRPASSAVLSTSTPPNGDVFSLEFDGASKGNPGMAGGGALLRDSHGNPVLAVKVGVGRATCNVAEYEGLIAGLRAAKENGVQGLSVKGDSMLVCMQVLGEWKVTAEHLRPLCEEAQQLAKHFQPFSICNVPRAQNSAADLIANEATHLPAKQVVVIRSKELIQLVSQVSPSKEPSSSTQPVPLGVRVRSIRPTP